MKELCASSSGLTKLEHLLSAAESAFSDHHERLHPVVLGCSRGPKNLLKSTHLWRPKWCLGASLSLTGFPSLSDRKGERSQE